MPIEGADGRAGHGGFESRSGRRARARQDLDARPVGSVEKRAVRRAGDMRKASTGKNRKRIRGSRGVDADRELAHWTSCTTHQQEEPKEARNESDAHGVSETGNARRFHRLKGHRIFHHRGHRAHREGGRGDLNNNDSNGSEGEALPGVDLVAVVVVESGDRVASLSVRRTPWRLE